MIDLKKHTKILQPVDIRAINLHIKWYGVTGAIEHALEDMKACQVVYDNGVHRCQTDSELYISAISEIFYIIENNNLEEEYSKNIIETATKIHIENLAFEIEHPKIDYSDKKKVKVGKKKVKQANIFTDEEQGKIKPARREKSQKLKELAGKFNLKLSLWK